MDEWVGAAEEFDAAEALVLASADEEHTFGPDELDTALFVDERAGAEAEGPGIRMLGMLLQIETGAGSSLADRVRAVAAFALGPTLRRGSGGPAVAALQRALASLGHDVAVDGTFGANTDRAVRAVQGRLHIPVNGGVGPQTKAAIAAALSGRSPAASVLSPATYDRAGALDYARKFWRQPCDDQFIALRSSGENYRKVPAGTTFEHEFAADGSSLGREHALLPDGSQIAWENLDDCTHFISCCNRPAYWAKVWRAEDQLPAARRAAEGPVRDRACVDDG